MALSPFPSLAQAGIDTDQIAKVAPNVLDQFRKSRDDAAVEGQNILRHHVGAKAASGDMLGASQAAMRGGDVKMGMDISNWDTDRRTKALSILTEGAQRADTPAKWSALVSSVEQTFGPQMVAQYRDFGSRPKAMTVLQEAKLSIEKQNAERDAALQGPRLRLMEAQAQSAEAAATNAGQPEIVRQLRAAGIDPQGEEGRGIIRNAIKGESPIDRAITNMLEGAMPGTTSRPAQPSAPGVKPMGFEGGTGQPQLIQTQTGAAPAPQAAPSSDPASAGSMFSGMPPEQRRRLGEALLLSPKTKALGEQMMKDIEREGLGKEAMNDLDKKLSASVEQLGRLEDMKQVFSAEFQTVPQRFKMLMTSGMAKLDPSKIKPEDKAQLEAFAKHRRRGFENVNRLINELSGAATSEQEAARIKMQVPDPGTGLFDGDDPVTYESKLTDSIRSTKLALARRAYMKKNNPQLLDQLARNKFAGVEGYLSLERMSEIMNERKNQIYQELKSQSPGASKQQLIPFVGERMRSEFGI